MKYFKFHIFIKLIYIIQEVLEASACCFKNYYNNIFLQATFTYN